MRTFLLAVLTYLSAHATFAHEGHQAFHSLKIENGQLILVSKLELPDLKSAIEKAESCGAEQDFNWCASAWLADNVSVTINGKTHSLILESSLTDGGHLLLTHSIGKPDTKIESIEVGITAFTQAFSHYENILELEINESKEGFKLDENRTSITHTINQK